jgi:hypothetical protein
MDNRMDRQTCAGTCTLWKNPDGRALAVLTITNLKATKPDSGWLPQIIYVDADGSVFSCPLFVFEREFSPTQETISIQIGEVEGCPTPQSAWLHHSGKTYTVMAVANVDPDKSSDVPLVVYSDASGVTWSRPMAEWHSSFTAS